MKFWDLNGVFLNGGCRKYLIEQDSGIWLQFESLCDFIIWVLFSFSVVLIPFLLLGFVDARSCFSCFVFLGWPAIFKLYEERERVKCCYGLGQCKL